MVLGCSPKMMRVDQPSQVKQRIDRDSWVRFISELITDLRAQHPIGYRHLRTTGKPNNQNCSVDPPQMANYFNFYAIEGMKAIANLCCVQIMSSMSRPCGTASQLTFLNPART